MQWKKLNTCEHGLPQNRLRFYLVAILEALVQEKPLDVFPRPVVPKRVSSFIPRRPAVGDELIRPSRAKACRANIKDGEAEFRRRGIDPTTTHCFIDIHSSPGWGSRMVERCPCLTRARCRQHCHYLTCRGGMLSLKEITWL